MNDTAQDSPARLVSLASEIVAAHVGNNRVDVRDLPALISNVHGALAGLGKVAGEARPEPAVPVRASVRKHHLVCLEDGKKLRTLRHHLLADHGLTPDEYRSAGGCHPTIG